MTREEAVKRIQDIKKNYQAYLNLAGAFLTKNECEAIDMAIEALEKERNIGDEAYAQGWANGEKAEASRHKSDDCISKQIEYLKFAIASSTGKDDYMVGLRNGLRLALSNLDGEEPQFEKCQPKKGEWLGSDDWYHKCSECKEVAHFYYEKSYNFCPNCGAQMRGDKE